MTTRRLVALALLVPVTALAWGKKKEEKTPALKVGVNHACLGPLAAGKDNDALVAMGIVDQARGNLSDAKAKYTIATGTGFDVLAAPVNVTLAAGVIWVQSEACPVPVPDAPAAELEKVEKLSTRLEPEYPRVLLSVRSDGSVRTTIWVAADGKAARIHVDDVGVGPVGISKRRDPGEEAAERMVARVQIALQAIEQLRAHDFGTDLAGKVFEWKLAYLPPKDARENLPGAR